jgi:hypothetical protein
MREIKPVTFSLSYCLLYLFCLEKRHGNCKTEPSYDKSIAQVEGYKNTR